jgi:hypothetical protein
MIRDFKEFADPPFDVVVSLFGFGVKYGLEDHIQYDKPVSDVVL